MRVLHYRKQAVPDRTALRSRQIVDSKHAFVSNGCRIIISQDDVMILTEKFLPPIYTAAYIIILVVPIRTRRVQTCRQLFIKSQSVYPFIC
jgi:hypothetical protein